MKIKIIDNDRLNNFEEGKSSFPFSKISKFLFFKLWIKFCASYTFLFDAISFKLKRTIFFCFFIIFLYISLKIFFLQDEVESLF